MVRGKNAFVQPSATHYRDEKQAELQMLVVDRAESETSDVDPVEERESAQKGDQRYAEIHRWMDAWMKVSK